MRLPAYQSVKNSLPARLKNSSSEFVCFSTHNPRSGSRRTYESQACYGSIMYQLGEQDILCRPRKRRPSRGSTTSLTYGRLSSKDFASFGRRLKESGLAPKEVVFSTGKIQGNRMKIPSTVSNAHRVYILLCLYRWQETKPRDCAALLKLHDRLLAHDPKYPFLQALHFALCASGMNSGHGFLSGKAQKKNPAWGWALSYFLQTEAKKRRVGNGRGTYSELENLSKKLNPLPKYDPYDYVPWDQRGRPKVELKEPTQLLHPRFSVLYTDPRKIDQVKFLKLMQQKA